METTKYVFFAKNISDLGTESDIIENKSLFNYAVRAYDNVEMGSEEYYLAQLLELAIEHGEFLFISEETYNELNK
jgi:hypothetical protein